jgi:hypothetical protein
MTPEQATTALTLATQYDRGVKYTKPLADLWFKRLHPWPYEAVEWCIQHYYSSPIYQNPDGTLHPLSLGVLARMLQQGQETTEAQESRDLALERSQIDRAEIEAGRSTRSANSWRSRNPSRWDELMAAGAEHRRNMIAEHGDADPLVHGILPEGHPLKDWRGR